MVSYCQREEKKPTVNQSATSSKQKIRRPSPHNGRWFMKLGYCCHNKVLCWRKTTKMVIVTPTPIRKRFQITSCLQDIRNTALIKGRGSLSNGDHVVVKGLRQRQQRQRISVGSYLAYSLLDTTTVIFQWQIRKIKLQRKSSSKRTLQTVQ
jgi:hypothetical protein